MDAEAYADMLPWLVFVVIERKTGLGLGWAGGCAFVSALALVGAACWRGRHAPVALLAVPLFALLCVTNFFMPALSSQFADARAVAVVVLGAVAFVSLRLTPLSTAYTSTQVAPSIQADDRFLRVNAEITAAWSIGAALVAVAYVSSDLDHSPVAITFLNWVVPLGLVAATLFWSAQRWQRFRTEIDTPVESGTAGRGSLAHDLGSWVESHDAVIHRFPAQGGRNA